MKSWIEYYQKSVSDLGGPDKCKPSSGLPCALAGIRYLRDLYIEDMSANGKPIKECQPAVEHINASTQALWAKLKKDGVNEGFLSNASAAAKAAGFKSEAEKVLDIVA